MLKQFIVALCFLVTSCTSTEAPNNLQANEQATNASDTTAQSNAGDDSGADQSAIGYAPDGSLSAEEQRQANQELHAPTNAE